ncbi:MAG TPA: MEDS domain-containing protein [Kofleriaceae bacterium]
MPVAASEPTPSQSDSFGRLPYGTHLCHLYRGERELFSAAVPFIRAGLDNHERCLWVTSDPAVLRRRVGGGDGELEALFDSGQIDIVHQGAWHGNASLRCLEAVAAGYRGLRVASDMACLAAEPLAGQIVALCSYPIEGCSSLTSLRLRIDGPVRRVRADKVRDRGPGIAPEQLENLFERFTPHGPRPGGGLGIGLWIVREIVTALGGTIAVASQAGCAFIVDLPSGDESTASSGARAEA